LRPFIEIFRWQSGKSLKLNLVDIHHLFWNRPKFSEVQLLLRLTVVASLQEFLLKGIALSFLKSGESGDSKIAA
jgi:hypothetical protein